jgi:hypothetical protein
MRTGAVRDFDGVRQFNAEVEGARRGGSPARFIRMLRQVTGLFLSDAARLNEHQIGIFNEVMVLWVERVETRTLAQLSMTLADLPSARRKQLVVLPATRRQVSPLRFRAIQSHFPKWT